MSSSIFSSHVVVNGRAIQGKIKPKAQDRFIFEELTIPRMAGKVGIDMKGIDMKGMHLTKRDIEVIIAELKMVHDQLDEEIK